MSRGTPTPTEVMAPPVVRPDEAKTLVRDLNEPPPLPAPPLVAARKATFQMISMKSPAELAAEKAAPVAKQVQLRSLAEAGGRATPPPGALGFLAPPRDPAAEPRVLSAGLYVALMGLGALALAAVIATAMWFLADR